MQKIFLWTLILYLFCFAECFDQYPGVTEYIKDYFKGSKEKWTYFPATLFPYFYSPSDTCKIIFKIKYICNNNLTVKEGQDNFGYEYLQVCVRSHTTPDQPQIYFLFFFWRSPIFKKWIGVGPRFIEIPAPKDSLNLN